MTTFETISATLGILGFVIAATNAVWTFQHHRPRLLIIPRAGHLFDADVTEEPGYFSFRDPPRRAKIVDIIVEISNCSTRNNSVISMKWHSDGEIIPLFPKAIYEVGYRIRDFSEIGSEKDMRIGEYWRYPKQWEAILPVELSPGTSRQAHCSGEVANPRDLGISPRFTISVTDAYGRSYTKSVMLRHGAPTDAEVIPLNADVEMSEAADSKKTV